MFNTIVVGNVVKKSALRPVGVVNSLIFKCPTLDT